MKVRTGLFPSRTGESVPDSPLRPGHFPVRADITTFETRTGLSPSRTGDSPFRPGHFPVHVDVWSGHCPVRGNGCGHCPVRGRGCGHFPVPENGSGDFPVSIRTGKSPVFVDIRTGHSPVQHVNVLRHKCELSNEATNGNGSLSNHVLSVIDIVIANGSLSNRILSILDSITDILLSVMASLIGIPLLLRVVVGCCGSPLNSITTAIQATPLTMVNTPRGSLAMARPAKALGLLSPPGLREVQVVTHTIRSLIQVDHAESFDSTQLCWDVKGTVGPNVLSAENLDSSHWCRDQDFSKERQSEKEGSTEMPPRLTPWISGDLKGFSHITKKRRSPLSS